MSLEEAFINLNFKYYLSIIGEEEIIEEGRNDVFLVFELMDGDLSKYLESMHSCIPISEVFNYPFKLKYNIKC